MASGGMWPRAQHPPHSRDCAVRRGLGGGRPGVFRSTAPSVAREESEHIRSPPARFSVSDPRSDVEDRSRGLGERLGFGASSPRDPKGPIMTTITALFQADLGVVTTGSVAV